MKFTAATILVFGVTVAVTGMNTDKLSECKTFLLGKPDDDDCSTIQEFQGTFEVTLQTGNRNWSKFALGFNSEDKRPIGYLQIEKKGHAIDMTLMNWKSSHQNETQNLTGHTRDMFVKWTTITLERLNGFLHVSVDKVFEKPFIQVDAEPFKFVYAHVLANQYINVTMNCKRHGQSNIHDQPNPPEKVTFIDLSPTTSPRTPERENSWRIDTGDHHSSSKIGLTIGLTLLIITVLCVAAFYILKRRRNRQLKIHLEKGQGEDIENSKSSAQNDPMEKESLLQKAEDKKEDIYSTENETKSDEAIPDRISEVAGDFEATRYNNFCLEEHYEISNKTGKHDQENMLTEVTFEETTTNQESGANNFCKSGELPFVHESSIHDEPEVKDSHMESAQHLLKVDPIEGNTTMRSKENPKTSIIHMPRTMQHNTVNLTEPSGMDTHGTQNQNDGILKDTDAYRTADSESTETDIRTKEGNLKFSKEILINQSAVGQDTADFGMMVKTDRKESPKGTKEVIQGKETTKELQAKGDTNSKSSTEILCNKDGKHKNTFGKVPVSNRPPVSEDVFDKNETKRALVPKTKTKKATKKSEKSKSLSHKTHPPEGTNVHCKNTVQDISTSVIEQSEDCSRTASLTIQDSSKSHRSRETASQLAVVDNVAQLSQPKIKLPQITRGSKLGVSDQEENLGLFGQESDPRFSQHTANLGVSNQESNLCFFEEEGKPGHVAKEINQSLFEQSPPSQAQIQSDNIQVLQSNKIQKQDIYNYEIQQRREMVQPSAEDKINITKEGFETITNKSYEAMNGESGTSPSSRKANKSQDHRDNRHPNNATNKQLAYGNKRITRGLAFPINYQGADMVSHDHPQLEHLGATCKELASATKDKILEAFNLRSGNQHLINKSSTSCNFHKNIYKIPLRKQPHRTRGGTLLLYVPIERRKKAMENRIRRLIHFNKSGWISETSTNPHEEEMFCLKKISTIFRHKSSIWKYKHFHRNRRKHFSRNKPPKNNRDALHVCNLVQMRNTCLKKSGYRGRGLCKVAKFNLNIGSFINISPRWVNKRFQRALHKKFTRKLSYGNNLDLLHKFNRLNMGKKENRIRYLLQNVRYPLQNKTWFLIRNRILYLLLKIVHHLSIRNKSNCQIYQNSLRKNTFQSMSHQSIEMKETSVEDDSAMEVSQITEDIEFDKTASKGLPSSDEEMS